MKNILKFTLFAALTSSFFSCNQSTGVSLTKRHYRSGYNVEIAGKIKTDKHRNTALGFVKPEKENGEFQKFKSLQVSGQNYAKQNNLSLSEGIAKKDFIVSPGDDKPKKRINLSAIKSAKVISNSIKVVSKIPLVSKVIVSPYKTSHTNEVNSSGNIIWTVIGVLLVLWLLSLLTGGWGLGGLLYLFLVVALVLILLRLLRVI